MCTTGSEDAVTVQAGKFSWHQRIPVLEKCVCMYVCVLVMWRIASTDMDI